MSRRQSSALSVLPSFLLAFSILSAPLLLRPGPAAAAESAPESSLALESASASESVPAAASEGVVSEGAVSEGAAPEGKAGKVRVRSRHVRHAADAGSADPSGPSKPRKAAKAKTPKISKPAPPVRPKEFVLDGVSVLPTVRSLDLFKAALSPPDAGADELDRVVKIRRTASAPLPGDWEGFLSSLPESPLARLRAVNAKVNAIPYRDDGDPISWRTLREVEDKGVAVCRDFVAAKHALLLRAGFEDSDMRVLNLAPQRPGAPNHIVLLVRSQGSDWILDIPTRAAGSQDVLPVEKAPAGRRGTVWAGNLSGGTWLSGAPLSLDGRRLARSEDGLLSLVESKRGLLRVEGGVLSHSVVEILQEKEPAAAAARLGLLLSEEPASVAMSDMLPPPAPSRRPKGGSRREDASARALRLAEGAGD